MFSKSVVKYIQSLQHKKFRDEYKVFIAEGPKVVGELLTGKHFICKHIYATHAWMIENKTANAEYASITTEVADFEMEKLSGLQTPNQVLAAFAQRGSGESPRLKNKLTLILDDIRDPGNLGTIIRLADWFNIENIICSNNTVDMYNPKVVQSTMASLGRVNIFYTDLETFIRRHADISLYCAVLDGNIINKEHVSEGFLLIGNEGAGIRSDLLKLPHKKISIEKFGRAESLNAAVAAGILLFAMK